MCSVRQRPMPSAPSSRALAAASAGVSAFARTPHAPDLVRPAGDRAEVLSVVAAGGTSGLAPSITSPRVRRRYVITSPSRTSTPATRNTAPRHRRSRSPPRPPRTACPSPRATTAACDVMPPRAVSTPGAATTPWMSSAVVSTAHQDHVLAGVLAARLRGVCVEHDDARPLRPATRCRPVGDHRRASSRTGRSSGAAAGRAGRDRSARAPLSRRISPRPPGRGRSCSAAAAVTLAGAGLQQVQGAPLDGELDVLHLAGSGCSSSVMVSASCAEAHPAARTPSRPAAGGVRMPATTSSPWAFRRYSPYSSGSPVDGLRVKATPVAGVARPCCRTPSARR